MRHLNGFFVAYFIFLFLSSLLVLSVAPTVVQAVDKPSAPQFSVKLVNNSYDVPPSTTTDPYTGATTTEPGYHVNAVRIVITIKNQPFTPSTNEKGGKYALYYESQEKGHFEDSWSLFKRATYQSDSGYTILESSTGLAAGSQLDIRIQAVIGKPGGLNYVYYGDDNDDTERYRGPYLYQDVVSSDWSSVQTVTIEYSGSSTVPPSNTLPINPSDPLISGSNVPPVDSPPQNLLPTYLLITITTVCLITIPLVIVAYHYGQRKNKHCPNNNPFNTQTKDTYEVKTV
ncbi:MAG: hypothetical protein FWF27_05775 [Candidatus Bathyarchaeota archaeon]|nr:hypothetical protein [Candidatus Termiticorpusculum sp.]